MRALLNPLLSDKDKLGKLRELCAFQLNQRIQVGNNGSHQHTGTDQHTQHTPHTQAPTGVCKVHCNQTASVTTKTVTLRMRSGARFFSPYPNHPPERRANVVVLVARCWLGLNKKPHLATHNNARTVPAQCPYSARTVPETVPEW